FVFLLIPSETANKFKYIYIFKWKEEIYLCLFAFYDRKRGTISYLLTLPCRLENISFIFWIAPLSHKKNLLFPFADK
ncbi:hypothetical protein, partial [Hoylesella pleuritidis]|uniref:hypothetical protein n=1 Tax=Hoylesella pleuritidis TaxID=407975 RepID=UPI0028ED510E